MKTQHDLSQLEWTLTAHLPFLWRFNGPPSVQHIAVPVRVPGSVQAALRAAGQLPDWNVGNNARLCEWAENRHWVYETRIPDDWVIPHGIHRLHCLGLDYSGWVRVDDQDVGTFRGSHVPHVFDLTRALSTNGRKLQIAFDMPPRWLGQFGKTSEMTEFKTRFNYTWDWIPRLVQIGISDAVWLETTDGIDLGNVCCVAETANCLRVWSSGPLAANHIVHLCLAGDDGVVCEKDLTTEQLSAGISWENLPVATWWPNGHGAQPLYTVTCQLRDAAGQVHDRREWRIGFRTIEWQSCEGASQDADQWICVVNSKKIFLQGVNWPPIRPNYADVTADDYRKRLQVYRDIGLNTFRVNGCGILEKEDFYSICDEYGLLVWQDFPLSSSGIENLPPFDPAAIDEMIAIAHSYIARRRHHPSLFLWCGGNELCDLQSRPVSVGHPMINALARLVDQEDPTRRFVPSSPSGPRFSAEAKDFGKGLHWDVHGPWTGMDPEQLEEYYRNDDALFRSEIYAPGAAPVELIRHYAGALNPLPISTGNPLWNNPVTWWLEDQAFAAEHNRPPESLEEYVTWSQQRQAQFLCLAMRACKKRFPAIGGVLIWCGHDCFPCPANTSLLDFEGKPKPAAIALAEIWKQPETDEARAMEAERN